MNTGPTRPVSWQATPGWGITDDPFGEVDAITVADDGTVYLFGRWPTTVRVYSRDGVERARWDASFSERPHGLAVVGDRLYCVDAGDSAIKVLDSRDGRIVDVFGTPGAHSDTGVDWDQPDTISRLGTVRGGPPFNRPTGIAPGPGGTLFVSDGYGNCRIHEITTDGTVVGSFGTPGGDPGSFNLPHGITVDADGRVYVADRENDRVQVFGPTGELLDMWTDVRLPSGICRGPGGLVLVAEVGKPSWRHSIAHPDTEEDHPPRVTVRTAEGEVVGQIGHPTGTLGDPGVLIAPHCVAMGPDGTVFVGELADAVAKVRGLERPLPAVQRFECHW